MAASGALCPHFTMYSDSGVQGPEEGRCRWHCLGSPCPLTHPVNQCALQISLCHNDCCNPDLSQPPTQLWLCPASCCPKAQASCFHQRCQRQRMRHMGMGTVWQLSAGELAPAQAQTCPQPLVCSSLFCHRWASRKQAYNMRSYGEPRTCWMWPGSNQVLSLGSFQSWLEAPECVGCY